MVARTWWRDVVAQLPASGGHRGGCLLAFAGCRPDLWPRRLLTDRAGGFSLPGRGAQVPWRRGQQGEAGQLGERLHALARDGAVFNAEARLAMKGLVDRPRWLLEFTNVDWPVLCRCRCPPTAFAAEADTGSPRYVRFDESALPPLPWSAGWHTEQERSCLGN